MLQKVCALLLMFCCLTACVSAPPLPDTNPQREKLLDSTILFGTRLDPAPVQDMLEVSNEMRTFIANGGFEGKSEFARLRHLMELLESNGFFVDQYDAKGTHTAAATFARRKGNCVAYTNLFVALAREVKLDAQFHLVDTRPEWNVEGGYLMRNNHLNVMVKAIHAPGYPKAGISIEFNVVRPEKNARSRTISDAYAQSLYYANIAVDHLHARD